MNWNSFRSVFLGGLAVIAAMTWSPLNAEDGPTRQQLQQELTRLRMEMQQLKEDFRAFQEAVRRGPVRPEKLSITGFNVEGSSIDKETLDEKLQSLTEKKLTLDQLQIQARTKIQEAYLDIGVRGVQVIIPPQEITDQPLTVEVTEPKLGFLAIEGNRFFGDKNIRRFFEGKITTPEGMLVARDLEAQLDSANRHPDRQVTAVLQPGDEQGVSDITLKVRERKPLHGYTPFHYSLGWSTSGTPNVGRLRLSNTFQYTNLFDRDHIVSVNWVMNPGNFREVHVIGTSYRIPFVNSGHAFTLFGGYSRTATNVVIDSLEITGDGHNVGGNFTFKMPKFWTIESSATFGVSYSQSNNSLEFGTFTVIESEIGQLPFDFRYSWQKRDTWGTTLGYLYTKWNPGNLVSNGARENFEQFREDANSSYIKYRVGVQRYQRLAAGWTLHMRFDGQYTDDELIPGEQFRLGGASNVRGYESGEVSGDRGFMVRTEFRTPPLFKHFSRLFKEEKQETTHLVGFVDYGLAKLEKPIRGDPNETDLAGAGFGLRYQFSEYFVGTIDFAWALMQGSVTSTGDAIAHVNLQISF
jgi:hemolysin activation/secretion protein